MKEPRSYRGERDFEKMMTIKECVAYRVLRRAHCVTYT